MLSRLPAPLRGALTATILGLNTLIISLSLVPPALAKLLLPFKPVRRVCDRLMNALASRWVANNNAWIAAVQPAAVWDVQGVEGLHPHGWYLVSSNHQSWVDILVLQKVFNRRIPLLRFFLKRQLFWVPLLGLAWWALDFPFMGRYSRAQIVKNPALGLRDRETTRRACAKFRSIPVSVMNFVEGTRFTPEKHDKQGSPYRHLLKPKSGGVAFVLDAMGDTLESVLDVTIVYPGGRPTMLDLMGDRIPEVRVAVRERPIPTALLEDEDRDDAAYRARFQRWVNGLWTDKDAEVGRLLGQDDAAVARG